jgi:hypothetical protein
MLVTAQPSTTPLATNPINHGRRPAQGTHTATPAALHRGFVSSIGRDCKAHTAGEACPVRAAHPHESHLPRGPNKNSTRALRRARSHTLYQRCTQNAAPHRPPAPRTRTGHPCTPAAAAALPAPGAANPRRASRHKPPPHDGFAINAAATSLEVEVAVVEADRAGRV